MKRYLITAAVNGTLKSGEIQAETEEQAIEELQSVWFGPVSVLTEIQVALGEGADYTIEEAA